MPQFVPKRFEQILQQMVNTVVARTDLSDVGDASIMKHFLGTFARELDEAYFQITRVQDAFNIDTARGDDLDRRAQEIAPGIITRRLPTKAVGSVVFSRAGTSGTINIPIGTVVKTAGGVEFVTTALGTILDTFSSSGNVAAIAVLAGVSGNVSDTTIVKFDSKPAGVDAVDNPANFSGGFDKESDVDFRDRIREFIASLPRSTVQALEFAAEEVSLATGQRVVSAKAVEDIVPPIGNVDLFIDDGAGTAESTVVVSAENITTGFGGGALGGDSALGGEEFANTDNKPVKDAIPVVVTSDGRGVLVRDTDFTLHAPTGQLFFTPALIADEIITMDYTYFDGLIQAVQKVIDGDPADRANFPGFRAGGVCVFVLSPTISVQQIDANITVAEGFAFSAVSQLVEDALLEHINNLVISGDVVKARLIEVIMSVDGVNNVNITIPVSDVVILDDQLARIAAVNVTIT